MTQIIIEHDIEESIYGEDKHVWEVRWDHFIIGMIRLVDDCDLKSPHFYKYQFNFKGFGEQIAPGALTDIKNKVENAWNTLVKTNPKLPKYKLTWN